MNKLCNEITVCLDMAGCPNRCRHCWLGHSKNVMLEQDELAYVSNEFSPLCNELTLCSWFREPDYRADYKELWSLENKLSINAKPKRFELLSVWRLSRDVEYIDWLKTFDVKAYQLTFFGMKDTTDFYTGRKGAFRELINATELLLDKGLLPRWQLFVYHDNIDDINRLFEVSKELNIKQRCRDIGGEFNIFFHQGSCDGEGRKLYDNWLCEDDIKHLPKELIDYNLMHFDCENLKDVLGITESGLIEKLSEDSSAEDLSKRSPVLFVNNNFDVYPNFSERSLWFRLGNLKKDGAEKVLYNYKNNVSFAQKTSAEVPVCELVKLHGNKKSKRLFTEEDFKSYLLNSYCQKKFTNRI